MQTLHVQLSPGKKFLRDNGNLREKLGKENELRLESRNDNDHFDMCAMADFFFIKKNCPY